MPLGFPNLTYTPLQILDFIELGRVLDLSLVFILDHSENIPIQIIFMIFCDTPAEIEVSFHTDGDRGGGQRAEGQTDVKVEIVI